MKHIDATPKEVRKFGITFMILMLILTALSLYKGTAGWVWFLAAAGFFLLTGLFLQPVLRPIYIGWMSFAFALGWVNTRLILCLAFYLVFAPAGLFFRLFRKDILGLRFDKAAPTYWVKRERTAVDKERYKRLF